MSENTHEGIFGEEVYLDFFSKMFTGKTYVKPLNVLGDKYSVAAGSFEKGVVNHWHIHTSREHQVAQIMICLSGEGIYVEEGKEPVILHAGDVVEVPANVRHYHGASENAEMSQIVVAVKEEGSDTIWMERPDM